MVLEMFLVAKDEDKKLEPARSLTIFAHERAALEKGTLVGGAVGHALCCCCCCPDPAGQLDPPSTPVWGEVGRHGAAMGTGRLACEAVLCMRCCCCSDPACLADLPSTHVWGEAGRRVRNWCRWSFAGPAGPPSTPCKGEARWRGVQREGVAANDDQLGSSSLLPPPPLERGGTWVRRGVRGGTPLSAGGEVCSQRGLAANCWELAVNF